MPSKEAAPNRSGSQESGSSNERSSSKSPWEALKNFVNKAGNSYSKERHIDLPTSDSGTSNRFTKGGQDGAAAQETSGPESDEEDNKSPKTPTPEDVTRAKIAELEEILNDDNATEDEKYRAAYMRKLLLDGLKSRSLKELKMERSFVAKQLAEAMQDIRKYKPGHPTYESLLPKVTGLRNRLGSINEQIRKKVNKSEGYDGEKGNSKELVPPRKELVLYDGDGGAAGLGKVKNNPEAKYEAIDKLKQKVDYARNKYAELRAEYEQMGMFKNLLKSKELKKMMELARAELEGFMAQLVYQQNNKERSTIVNGVEGANEEEQKEARQKAIQSIAAAVLEQHALVDEKTQEAYDKRLDERSLFKKVAAKIGRWFVGKENKDGGKLGLGGWLRSSGTGLAAGVATGLFGAGFPITSAVGAVGGAGVKVAAHQRVLENARGEKRELGGKEEARFSSAAQSLEWTAEGQDRSKEAVASMVGAALAETQMNSENRQKNMTAIGRKATIGWGLGFAAGRAATEFIKSHITPDQKLANTDPSSGGDTDNPTTEQPDGGNTGNPPATEQPDGGDPGAASEIVSLGSDGWVWDRVADALGAEKAMPFLEQLAQTNPDFQLFDLPNGLMGIAYQGSTDPQVVADAIGKVAPDLLKQWM